jgi:pyruvate,water dikinase
MPLPMNWLPLHQFRDRGVPKLENLRRAAAAGLRVPLTWWLRADAIASSAAVAAPPQLSEGPVILRSGSPTEDGLATSNAGQLLSLVVEERACLTESLRRVIGALPRGEDGAPRGVVFVQPVVRGVEAGVTIFDGFYYERTRLLSKEGRALNQELTSGRTRGEVTRGYLERDEPWSEWLKSVYAVFGEDAGGDRRIDVEYTHDGSGYILLQVRPALFPVRRNRLLTLSNLRETLGEWPSPWTASSLAEAGRDLSFLIEVEPRLKRWEETFTVEAGDRVWVNLSLWARWMDDFGMSRTFATVAMGGVPATPADKRVSLGRFLFKLPGYLWKTRLLFRRIWTTRRTMAELNREMERARGLAELYRAGIGFWIEGVRTAMAIAGLAALALHVRQALRLPGSSRLVTQDMMEEYHHLSSLSSPEARAAGLEAWLARHGHRGPVESDIARPRFAELRDVLLRDLATARPAPPSSALPRPRGLLTEISRPFFWIDEQREWFRDAMMRSLQRMRTLVLEEAARLVAAGELDAPEDVFWLRGADLEEAVPLRQAVATAKARRAEARRVPVPNTATLDTIERLIAEARVEEARRSGRRVFPGVALRPLVVEGTVRKADDLLALLADGALGPDTILVVPHLEPSWAVLFPRVGGVVSEIGGELSHASILLREAGKPAIVNAGGIWHEVSDGDRVRLDGVKGVVEVLKEGRP